MPNIPSWILPLPEICRTVDALEVPVLDRASFEKLFGVRRRRAIQLMHRFGGYQAGRTFLIDRRVLVQALASIDDVDRECELSRRTKLVTELEKTRALFPARDVRIFVPAEARNNKMSDLPPGVHLRAGELRIEFHGTEDLLRHLFELSQAIVNDYGRFEAVCEARRSINA